MGMEGKGRDIGLGGGMIIHGYVIYTGLIDIFISFFFCLNGSRSNILFYTRNLKLNDCDGFFFYKNKKNCVEGESIQVPLGGRLMLTIKPTTLHIQSALITNHIQNGPLTLLPVYWQHSDGFFY